MRNLFVSISRNPISLGGAALATTSAILILTLFGLDLVGFHGGPYLGILAFLVFPGVFIGGLLLIPVGVVIERRRERRAADRGEPPARYPIIDINQTKTRKTVLIFLAASALNLVILTMATFKGVEVMESTAFCGTTCHSVMAPEFTTYQHSPHARVKCVSCHIGPGADWFVKSKLSGAWQVISTTFELYPKPIPTPVHNLRPARETCEQCHWPTKFVGDRLKVLTRYSEDEENTELQTVLLLRVGGLQGRDSHGIHWHVDPGNRIRYRADERRENIYDVELLLEDGTVKTFRAGDPPAEGEEGEDDTDWRTMDCVDCHNRPSHIYRLPQSALDGVLAEGDIDRTLPYIRREGLAALQVEYDSHEAARRGIADQIGAFYADGYPEVVSSRADVVNEAARVLGDIYCQNVFPAMNITWGVYPNHIGHQETPGCFRCHDDEHETPLGEVISSDCDTCHTLLAMEEEDPDILRQLKP